MKITKRYFDQSQREYEEIERKLELEKQGKTAEELAYEKRMVSEEGKVLFDKIKKAEQNTLFIRNKEKYDHFVMLYKSAIKMAELLGLNVEINTENPYHATIEFETNNLYLVKDVSREYHVLTGMLFAHADDVWIDKKENLIRIIFFFQINDRVQK